jgi:hypothetical protein
MPKVNFKIIGTFHSFHGAQSFATIRACCSSLKKRSDLKSRSLILGMNGIISIKTA